MKRLIFPIFNALMLAILGALLGYYVLNPINGIIAGAVAGFLIAFVIEYVLGIGGRDRWLYKRRVLLLILLEIPFLVFIVGPYAYVLVEFSPNPSTICCVTPLDYGTEHYDDVLIETEDGIILSGWYVPPQDVNGAVIILLHGARGNRLGTGWYATQLINAGYGVLMYDQRALGESTGDTLSFGWLDWADLLAVIDYVREQPEADPNRIGLVGLSGGGHIAMNAIYHDAPVQGVWIDGLQANDIPDFPQRQDIGEEFATLLNWIIIRMGERQLGRAAEPPIVEMLPEIDIPVVLIAGGLDDFESRANQQYAEVAPDNIDVWIIPNAPHVGGATVITDVYTERMLSFFEDTLRT